MFNAINLHTNRYRYTFHSFVVRYYAHLPHNHLIPVKHCALLLFHTT